MRLLYIILLSALSISVQAQQNEIKLVYVEWLDSIASSNIIRVTLEQMNYNVNMVSAMNASEMWQYVAKGEADVMVSAWLPTVHKDYLKALHNNVEDLGANLIGIKIGIAVPNYVTIDSLMELKFNANKFGGKIIGIDPNTGIMAKTKKMVKAYQLDSYFSLAGGSNTAMMTILSDAVDKQMWVAFTTWTPHWMFDRWSLKYLQDPKKIYGNEEFIHTIVRKGLKQDIPEAYKLLDKFTLNLDDIQTVMSWNQEEGAKPYENAQRWITENPNKISSWR